MECEKNGRKTTFRMQFMKVVFRNFPGGGIREPAARPHPARSGVIVSFGAQTPTWIKV
jgi:hypothetical protein